MRNQPCHIKGPGDDVDAPQDQLDAFLLRRITYKKLCLSFKEDAQ